MVKKVEKVTNGVKISFYVPKEWHDEIREIAEKNRIALSDVYRIAIKEYLDRHFLALK
uniref:Hypothetical CopG n=1 Tax=Saccharolobus solfataricus (strain ATCC 35092 / DSM 1617 / JCM 11322 / P2) TaxID=273057 RepID=A5GXY3_SACS2|nr:ORF56 family plasmid copy control protein [Saccharolobus solfataricus]ABA64561.1 hypothetical CopG [Saccharolobus solfataricus P2]